jgi:hypothetical protein
MGMMTDLFRKHADPPEATAAGNATIQRTIELGSRAGNPTRGRGSVLAALVAPFLVAVLVAGGCSASDDAADAADEIVAGPSTDTIVATTVDEVVLPGGGTDAAQEPEPAMVELSYWEGILLEDFSRVVQPDDECDRSDAAVVVCAFDQSVQAIATHLGRVTDTSTGTVTTYLSESCEGPDGAIGNRMVLEGEGSMRTELGEELFFRNRRVSCVGTPAILGSGYVVIDGGTGRFEGASGIISTLNPALEAGFASIGVGTLTVRADLWEDLIPGLAS